MSSTVRRRHLVRRLGAYTAALAFAGPLRVIAGENRQGPKPVEDVSEAYAWRRVAVGGGGFITGYDADLGGLTRVIRADVYGAYLWREDLGRWDQLVTSRSMPEADRVQNGSAEGVYEIVVAPSRPSRIYMAIKGKVYSSDDRGRRFSAPLSSPVFTFDANSVWRLAGPFLAVSPVDPDLVLFGTPSEGVWRSVDGGRHWGRAATLPEAPPVSPVSHPGGQATAGTMIWFPPVPGRATHVWAMVPGIGMHASVDGGASFAPLVAAGAVQPTSVTQGAFDAAGNFIGVDREGSGIWRYSDGSWTDLTPGIGVRHLTAVAVSPRNGRILVFDPNGRAWHSGDGGGRWWPLWHGSVPGEGEPPWLRVSNRSFAMGRVAFDPVVPNRLWAATGTGVYYADISDFPVRVQWVSQTRGVEELVANDVIKPPGGPPAFAAWDFGIHVKDDLDSFSLTYGPKERILISAQQVDWSPSDPRFLVTNATDARVGCCSEDGDTVLAGYSEDGGRSWRKFASLPHPPGTDAADPWRMSFGMIAVSAGDTRNIVWVPSYNRAPFYTLDRGRIWRRVSFPGETLPLTGAHAHPYLPRKALAADRVAGGTFYLVHSGDAADPALRGVWMTSNGGRFWTMVHQGEIAPASGYAAKLRAVPGRAGHLFFTSGVSGDGDTTLRRSVDGGRNWTALLDVDRVDDIGFGKADGGSDYPTLFISGRVGRAYGIWRSTDDAGSWRRVGRFPDGTLDQVSVVSGDPDRFGQVYLGYKGSGWIYGRPENCVPVHHEDSKSGGCHAVD
jgi:hypothetical protein